MNTKKTAIYERPVTTTHNPKSPRDPRIVGSSEHGRMSGEGGQVGDQAATQTRELEATATTESENQM